MNWFNTLQVVKRHYRGACMSCNHEQTYWLSFMTYS